MRLLATPTPAVQLGGKGGDDGYEVFHQIVRGFFCRVDDLDTKRRQCLEPAKAEACQAVLVLDEQHVHKIALQPTADQERQLRRAAGVARFTWNWALAEWKVWYKGGKRPSAMALKKHFNAIKGELFPWVYESPRDANAQPFANLDKAYKRFFGGDAKYPKFKKKGKCRDAFYVANDKFHVEGDVITLPRVGKVKMREALRFGGKVVCATVSRPFDELRGEPLVCIHQRRGRPAGACE